MYDQIEITKIREIYEKLGVNVSGAGCDNCPEGTEASYAWWTDTISLVPGRLYQSDRDAAILLHELVHWTQERLGRQLVLNDRGTALEEMIANYGAAILVRTLQLSNQAKTAIRDNLRQYQRQWMANEPDTYDYTIEHAMLEGHKAAEYIMRAAGIHGANSNVPQANAA